jgi:hypothetical protein
MLHWIRSLDRILKGEATRPDVLRQGTIDVPLGGLSVVILLLGMFYGACMGVFSVITRWDTPKVYMGWLQVMASAVKVPALFFLTLVVTLPSLYVFNALVGSRLSLGSLVRLLVAAIGVTMALQASFGTITLFFSISTTSYPFMVLLNVVLFAVSGFLGLGFLLQTLHRLSLVRPIAEPAESFVEPVAQTTEGVPAPPGTPGYGLPHDVPPRLPGALDRVRPQHPDQSVKNVFRIWVVVFGLVGAQMGWVLRPFVGHPNADFAFFRKREDNFFRAVVVKIEDLFGDDVERTSPRRR